MTVEEIADRFQRSLDKFGDLPVRLLKLRALCERSHVPVEAVISRLPVDVQARIKAGA